MWADFMLAALVISARLSTLAAPADGAHHEAIGSMLALVLAGWVTVAWTLHLYEWKVLYSWFPAAFLEEQALLFIPFINGRYILPVLMARMLLREGFVRVGDYPRDTVWTALGVKVVSLTCIVTGIGFVMADSEVYLEALGEGAALMVYAVGLL
jgi:hypothetical protein